MNKLQLLMYNDGERLVPYVSHDDAELVRHRSSYAFFYSVIETDRSTHSGDADKLTISDLGFGSGYGSALLSSLPNSQITGVDIGRECETFALQYYPRANVDYVIEDLAKYVPKAQPHDYVVSRGVLEHVEDGLELIQKIKFKRRAMVDVPYDEKPGNEHHVLSGIKEETFADFENCEVFYEDLEGRIFDSAGKPEKANMIMVVLSAPDLPKIGSMFQFPIEPIRDTRLERLSGVQPKGKRHYFNTPIELLSAVEKAVKETEVVMDIGTGIAPMNYFRPKLHMMVEPWQEYSDILSYRHAGDKSVIIIRTGALEALRQMADDSVDSIFLLDVIEHLEKEVGRQVLIEMERVARDQVVIFTPLGFMPQHIEQSETDGWGLGGTSVQEHLSGWEPEDFGEDWSFLICKDFHRVDFKGRPLKKTYGAFYAVCNFSDKIISRPEKMCEIRKPLPSELELELLTDQYKKLTDQYNKLEDQYNKLEDNYQILFQSRGLRVVRGVNRVLRVLHLRK